MTNVILSPKSRYASATLLFLLVGCASLPNREPQVTDTITAREAYQRFSPSIVFIETPIASGSGVLVEGGIIVTNAHVVWPYDNVRVVFPDRSEFDVPVLASDFLLDLAIIGPVHVEAPIVVLERELDVEIGDDVFLIGYPVESDEFPVPTISKGILSRVRSWDSLGVTYYQSDASIAGGQSGGVLVSGHGEVMGISGIALEGNSFALSISEKDVIRRIEALESESVMDGIGPRPLTSTGAYREISVILDTYWSTSTFFLEQTPSDPISVVASSDEDVLVYIVDAYGEIIETADEFGPGEAESIEAVPYTALRYVQVEVGSEYGATAMVESSAPMTLIDDPDDGVALEVGALYTGNLDFPYDYDYFPIELSRGDRIAILVESIMIDSYLQIDRRGESATIEDDDSGRGILGLDSFIVFEAVESGEHLIVVSDASGYESGGYRVIIREAEEGEAEAARSFDHATEPLQE